MEISVLVGSGFEDLGQLERAVSVVNEVQSHYSVSLAKVRWIRDNVNSVDCDKLFVKKEEEFGKQPAVIFTKSPLKHGWTADYRAGMYIVTVAGGRNHYKDPPLKTLLMYFIATSLGTFECQMTEQDLESSPVHEGRPIGCISDLCEKDGDLLISMKAARVCRRCRQDYISRGLSRSGLIAIGTILKRVKQETLKYDKKIPYDVFISYSHEDKRFVQRFVDSLEERGYRVWYDDLSLLPGESIVEKLSKGIAKSRCFIVVLSPACVKSGWCKHELAVALGHAFRRTTQKRLKVLPVLHKECRIPSYLEPFKYADLRRSRFDKGMNDVWAALRTYSGV